ncbi:MAG: response regulator [Candidatus Nomurabacteria bacterium]|jgi:two-component system alkaline phosphatase synthesis response regulator PhoP|nr:response regulator [Candidatus Nomurabacteria bacterium]
MKGKRAVGAAALPTAPHDDNAQHEVQWRITPKVEKPSVLSHKRNVYVVEDDDAMAAHLARVLKNYTVRTFSNGLDAIDAIDKKLPDVIILDIILDGPSGFALLNELQSYTDTGAVPVIVCSSMADELSELLDDSVQVVLDKVTMTPNDVREAVQKVLGG